MIYLDFSGGLIGIFQVVYLGFTGGSFGIFQVVYVEDTRPEVVVVDQPAVVAPVAPAGVCASLFLVFTRVNFFFIISGNFKTCPISSAALLCETSSPW